MKSSRQKAVLALMLVLLFWCTPTVFVKYLIPYYDPFTQNFYRYASSALLLLPWLFLQLYRDRSRLGKDELRRLFWSSIPNVLSQTTWPLAMKWLFPAFVALFNKSSILFSCLLAFAFFPEERWLFRSRRFLIGLLLSVIGTVGLSCLRLDPSQVQVNLALGLLLFSSFMWAVYSSMVKKYASHIGSRLTFAVISLYTTAWLVIPALIWGDLSLLLKVPWHVNVVLVISGILCIGLAHPLYFVALKELGLSLCATMLLSTPIGVLLLSNLVFGEVLTTGQLLFGAILLAGGALTLWVGGKPAPASVARAVEPTEG